MNRTSKEQQITQHNIDTINNQNILGWTVIIQGKRRSAYMGVTGNVYNEESACIFNSKNLASKVMSQLYGDVLYKYARLVAIPNLPRMTQKFPTVNGY